MTRLSTPATIETVKLDNVTGGCAACGNPNHRPESEFAYQPQR